MTAHKQNLMATSPLHYIQNLSYYQQYHYVSNSDLGACDDWINGRERPANIQAAYDFGNLIDALMTEPQLVDMDRMTVRLAHGTEASFTPELFHKAQNMKRDAICDPTLQRVFENMDFQCEIYIDEFRVNNEYADVTMPIRLKMDGNASRIRTGMDLKSTQCKTQAAFEQSLYHFNYDKQVYSYMEGSGSDRFWLLGVGKVAYKCGKHPVFKFGVKRGDPFYLSGQKKYERQFVQYHKYIYSLNAELI